MGWGRGGDHGGTAKVVNHWNALMATSIGVKVQAACFLLLPTVKCSEPLLFVDILTPMCRPLPSAMVALLHRCLLCCMVALLHVGLLWGMVALLYGCPAVNALALAVLQAHAARPCTAA